MFRLDSPVMAHERQEALYAFLLSQGSKWTRLQAVALAVGLYPEFTPTADFHDSTARRWMTSDIESINSSEDFEKIIISGSEGIKLADRAEYERFIAAEYKEIFRKLKRVRQLARKGALDRQMDLEGEIRQAFLEGS